MSLLIGGIVLSLIVALVIGKFVFKRGILAMITLTLYHVFLLLENSGFSIRKSSLKREENLSNDEKGAIERQKALEGLDNRELATLRLVDLIFGSLKYSLPPLPANQKPYTAEQIVENCRILKNRSSDAIFALNAGPFHQPDERPDFTLKGSSVKSLYFNFSKNQKRKIAILHFHGGAYVSGVSDLCYIHERWCSENSFDLLGLEYTTYPQSTVEQITEEAFRAFKWLVDVKGHSEIYVIGESAGGNLCWQIADKISQLNPSTDANYVNALKGAILLSPWCDMEMDTPPSRDLFHQDRLIRNEKIREWKLNGVPCGLGQQEKTQILSPYHWNREKWQRIASVLPKGMFISYTSGERLNYEIGSVLEKLKGIDNVNVLVEKIPFHVFHIFVDYLPDHYKRTVNGILNLIRL
ncbi:predicted protein [Naegleria gruberi]|uniref:Predicted protein n=1 Tax=Naegleria gruberi TaxID=5762 RepID=D2VMS6_NAEGR|nr:uncharacterized protein NAEGRDRAFT_70244 [Naegleria gruberi]EFC41882.1 predicted protein [Naegleria gruberi]|eukprot:XP_002674626.1 predicted protein [Naegleria gruberi strain NEG-M]